jgi:hypothetical protein
MIKLLPPLDVVQRLLDASRGWLRVAIALAVFGTQRNGEVRALRVMDVDFGSIVVNVRKAFSADVVVTPKSGDERAAGGAAPRDSREDCEGEEAHRLPRCR